MFKKSLLVGAMTLGLASSAFCDVVTLPDTGIDVSSYITAGVTILGGVAATAVGGYAAFLIVRKAFRWLSRGLG